MKYDRTEFAVELKIWAGKEYSCCVAGSSSVEGAVGWGLGGEAAPAWPAAWPKPSIHGVPKLLSSWLHSLPSSAGSLQVWEPAFLCGKVSSSSQDLLSALRAEQPVPSESLQPAAACVTDVPGLQQAQTLLGGGWEVAAMAEVALAWKLLFCPVPGLLLVLFSLRRLCFLLCRSYVLVNTRRIIFSVI